MFNVFRLHLFLQVHEMTLHDNLHRIQPLTLRSIRVRHFIKDYIVVGHAREKLQSINCLHRITQ